MPGRIMSAAMAFAVFILALLLLSEYSVVWDRSAYGDFGFGVGQGGGPLNETTVTSAAPGSPAGRAGIRMGDTVERPPSLHDQFLVTGQAIPRPGERLTLSLVREGRPHAVTIQAQQIDLSKIDIFQHVLSLTVGLVFIVVGLVLVLLRPGRSTWGFYLLSFAAVVAISNCNCWGRIAQGIPALWLVWLSIVPQSILTSCGIVGALAFCLRFPADRPTGWRKTLDSLIPFIAIATVAVGLTRDLAFLDFRPALVNGTTHAINVLLTVITITAAIVLVANYSISTATDRQRIKWVVLGFICMLVPLADLVLDFEGLLNLPDWVPDNLLFIPLPLAIGYAVLRHRVIDARFILSRSLIFGIIASLVVATVAGLAWLFSTKLPTSRFEVAFIAAGAILVGYLLNAARQSIGNAVDYLFFRQWHRAQQQADAIAAVIRQANSDGELYEPLTVGVAKAFSLASAALFERVEGAGFVRVAAVGWPTGTIWHILADNPISIRVAEKPRVVDVDALRWEEPSLPAGVARPTVAVPITAGRRLPAMLVCGAHDSGAGLDRDEVNAIRRLCADAALVYGRSPVNSERAAFSRRQPEPLGA